MIPNGVTNARITTSNKKSDWHNDPEERDVRRVVELLFYPRVDLGRKRNWHFQNLIQSLEKL